MRRQALIFDCDGVLAETEKDIHLPAFNRAFRDFGFDLQWGVEEYGTLLRIGGGKERMRTIPVDHPEAGFPEGGKELDQIIERLHGRKTEIYVELVSAGIPGRPGIRRLIQEAVDSEMKVAIASTSAEKSVRSVLHAVLGEELVSRIHGVYAGDVVRAKKPSPDIYLLALDQLGVCQNDALVIEDSKAGAAAAAAAGIPHIVTVSAFTAEDPFPDAIMVLSDLGEPEAGATVLGGSTPLTFRGIVDLPLVQTLLQGDPSLDTKPMTGPLP